MKKGCIALIVGFALASQALWANEQVIVAAFEYPPIYQNEADKGLAGDLVLEAFKAVNIDAKFQFTPVARMVVTVGNGEALCGIGGAVLFDAPEVKPAVTVGPAVQYVSQVYVYSTKKYPQGLVFARPEDAAPYRIGVLNASGIMKFLEKTPGLKLEAATGHDSTAKQLQMGRVDLWAIVDLTGLMYMKKLFPAESVDYRYTKAFNRGDVSVVFSKKQDPEGAYLKKFQEGLAAIKKNGTYMKVMAKYYGGKESINKEALTDDMK